jgi:hypothetical protein
LLILVNESDHPWESSQTNACRIRRCRLILFTEITDLPSVSRYRLPFAEADSKETTIRRISSANPSLTNQEEQIKADASRKFHSPRPAWLRQVTVAFQPAGAELDIRQDFCEIHQPSFLRLSPSEQRIHDPPLMRRKRLLNLEFSFSVSHFEAPKSLQLLS